MLFHTNVVHVVLVVHVDHILAVQGRHHWKGALLSIDIFLIVAEFV